MVTSESPSHSSDIRVASLRAGVPRWFGELGTESAFESSIGKHALEGSVYIGPEGVAGDKQANLEHHGGPDRAVCVYPASHYPTWSHELAPNETASGAGAFGENLTLEGIAETAVAIGDCLEAPSGLVLQVTQPRVPCWKLARRWGVPDMAARVVAAGRTGWYCRVLAGGELAQGELLVRSAGPHQAWTVERAHRVYHAVADYPGDALELAEVPLLSAATRASLYRKLQRGGYTPMACAIHDLLEDAAVRRVPLDLELIGPRGESETHRALIRDLKTEAGAEYAELSTSRLVRLDRIAGVDPVVGPPA